MADIFPRKLTNEQITAIHDELRNNYQFHRNRELTDKNGRGMLQLIAIYLGIDVCEKRPISVVVPTDLVKLLTDLDSVV